MDVLPFVEAHFILSIYYPGEIQEEWGYAYPNPPRYEQEEVHPGIVTELGKYDWDAMDHQQWMSRMPLSLLTDTAIMNEIVNTRLRRRLINPSAKCLCKPSTGRYQNKHAELPATMSQEDLIKVLLGDAAGFDTPLPSLLL